MEFKISFPPILCFKILKSSTFLIVYFEPFHLLERHGGYGTGRHFGELRVDWIERSGATNVPGDVCHPDDTVDRRSGTYHAGDTIHHNLRDTRHTTLGGH